MGKQSLTHMQGSAFTKFFSRDSYGKDVRLLDSYLTEEIFVDLSVNFSVARILIK